ncbi:ATP-dependent helicase HrpB [Catenovulum adriaticum]|uniref:ATP-dependent helicase HrpB n=1 Tax=Catenovulum adriaticum TaxID=2984846 RepID=A0ABY7AJW1_9ALTE|nr:ATP-dependent helicase HrpB [Catenovulum sp. TS8]WAJ69832.1 ATP-dependent helicase HrpB [Catenovulum sp. TS8]
MLPINAVLPEIKAALASNNNLVIQAPPGAGKSTLLPLELLNLYSAGAKKILLLEPRRVAARNIASYLAKQLNEAVGQKIGLRMRGLSKVSANTQLEVVTEGVLTRILQSDPELSDYQLIIFDEFHERSLNADFAFVLTQQVQEALRDDLQMLIMSATLDLTMLKAVLPDAPVIESSGRLYPIDYYYRPLNLNNNSQHKSRNPVANLSRHILSVVKEALNFDGDILVFLPGIYEINQVASVLEHAELSQLKISKLHGRLPLDEQQQALKVDVNGKRKIVLSTNIAETSLTIENIRIVIDSGLHKTAQFDHKTDFNQLITERISKASSIQRAGRAGRLDSGVCFRLWTEDEQNRLREQYPAEIEKADLSQILFETRLWGENDIYAFNWPTKPRISQLKAAEQKLINWQLMSKEKQLTKKARQLTLSAGDIASSLLIEQTKGSALAYLIAAYLQESQKSTHWDMRNALLAVLKQDNSSIKQQAQKNLGRKLSLTEIDSQLSTLAELLVPIWPQRMAKLKHHSEQSAIYVMASGSAVELRQLESLNPPEYLLVMDAGFQNQKANGIIYSAVQLEKSEFEKLSLTYRSSSISLEIDLKSGQLKLFEQTKLFNILLAKQALTQKPTGKQLQQAWLTELQSNYQNLLSESQKNSLNQFIARWNLASQVKAGTRLVSANVAFNTLHLSDMFAQADEWLALYLTNVSALSQFQNLNLVKIWLDQQAYQLQTELNNLCPVSYQLPDGRQVKIDYVAPAGPSIKGFMQSFYGVAQHPSILAGQQALVVELLSPAKRAIQTTQDLIGFWHGSYPLVQKDMKANYPKHYWPDDPANASAGTATKRQRQSG